MTVVIPVMYVRIMEDISGAKSADRVTDFMTGRLESCTCGDAGICWKRRKVRSGSRGRERDGEIYESGFPVIYTYGKMAVS